jgi:hypothetical protein
MTVDELRRLLVAPEIIVLDLALASLRALERALLLEHPLLDAPPSADDPAVRRRARAVLRHAARLRRDIRVDRGVVETILRDDQSDNDLF